jgi:hypothetical protein
MIETHRTVTQEVERYLLTGEIDPYRSAWSGSFLERERHAHNIFAWHSLAQLGD